MKKSIIAAGATAAVLAAMPVLGTFAATNNSFTDTLTVSITDGCTLENSTATAGDYSGNDRSFSATDVVPGSIIYLNATGDAGQTPGTTEGTISISCNTGGDSNKFMVVAVDVDGFTGTTAANTFTGGDGATSGATSTWAIKSNATISTAPFTSNPFADYAAAADNASFLKASTDKTVTFNPSYRVYVAPGQANDTYRATAEYTVTVANN